MVTPDQPQSWLTAIANEVPRRPPPNKFPKLPSSLKYVVHVYEALTMVSILQEFNSHVGGSYRILSGISNNIDA